MSKDEAKKPVMDVSKPGKSAPSASSRPIIVGHKPMIQDPMVNEQSSGDQEAAQAQSVEVTRTSPKVIEPLSSDLQQVAVDEPESEEVPADESNNEVTAPDEQAEPTDQADNQTESPTVIEKTTETKVIETVVEKAANKKDEKSDKQDKAEKEKQQKINQLIEEKKYFVPIGQPAAKKRRGVLLAIILLLFGLVGGYLAVDYFTDIALPYEFFKKSEPVETAENEAAQQDAADTEADINDQADTLPAGYVRFQDAELGFSFGYPESWGEAKVGPSVESEHLSSGSEFEISFSKNDKVTVGGQTADREHSQDFGHGGIVYAAVFAGSSPSNSYQIDQGPNLEHLQDDKSAIVSLPVFQEECIGVATILSRSLLPSTGKYPKIAFMYMHTTTSDGLTQPDCEAGSFASHIIQTEVNELKTINQTINSLSTD